MDDDRTLPEFGEPPLSEVVLGIQFNAPVNYQHILAYPVWLLFQSEFPVVQEMAPLAPQFETFGLPSGNLTPFNIGMGKFPGNRYWFINTAGDELIQFQSDRLLHNWRKIGEGQDYPRFEAILPRFRSEISRLEGFVRDLGNERLLINQAELSYLNAIPVGEGPLEPERWLSFAPKESRGPEDFNSTARFALYGDGGSPYARLHREVVSGLDPSGRRVLGLNFTVRGFPQGDSVDNALDFIAKSRHIISQAFLEATTPEAQKIWKRSR